VSRNDSAESIRDHLEQPRRVLDYLREAVAVEPVAIHPDVDQRRRAKANRKCARDVGSMKIVDLGIKERAGALLRASAVGCDQQKRRIGIDHLEP